MKHTGVSNNKEPRIIRIVDKVIQQVKQYTTSPTYNYCTLLATQVEDLGLSHEQSAHSYVTSILGDRNSSGFDTGATSIYGRIGDKLQPTTQKSHKTFHILTGKTTAAST